MRPIDIVCAAALCTAPVAQAGWFDGGALEITQYANNMELVSQVQEAVATTEKLRQQYEVQLRQFEEQLLAGKRLAADLGGLSLADLGPELRAVLQLRGAYQSLRGDLEALAADWQTRINEANLRHQTWQEYVTQEIGALARKQQRAVQRLREEQTLFTRIEEDYAAARKLGDQIQGTEGVHQSMQLLNTHANRLVQQNARMLEMLNRAYGADKAIEEQAEAQRAQQDLKARELERAQRVQSAQRMQDAVRGLSAP